MILPPDAPPEDVQEMIYEAEWVGSYLPPDEEPMEPISDIFYPILPSGIDTFNQNDDDFDRSDQSFAGHLTMSFYWRSTIRDILPEGSDGILVVFENPCNPTFTYQIVSWRTFIVLNIALMFILSHTSSFLTYVS